MGTALATNNPEFAHWRIPWLFFFWASSVPFFVVLVIGWKVAGAIRHEKFFSLQTANLMKVCSMVLFCGAGFFLLGNGALLLFDMSHPAILLVSFFAVIFCALLATVAAALSHYIAKAAALQTEAEGTI